MRAPGRFVLAWLTLLSAPAVADVIYESFDDQAAFEERLRGTPRVIGFDDIAVDGSETAFLADRYAATGAVIAAQAAGGQFASRGFGSGAFRPQSKPNVYAPGPVGGMGNATAVTFRSDTGGPGLVAGFGATFIDADFPNIAQSSLSVLDRAGQVVALDDTIRGRNGSRVFRGIIAVDGVTGEPVPVIATARIVSGEGWPAVRQFEGVALDDFVFDAPVPNVASGAFDFDTGAVAKYESAGSISVRVRRLGGTTGAAQVTLTTTPRSAAIGEDFTEPPTTVSFADGEAEQVVEIPIANDLADEEHETFSLALSAPTGGAVLGNRTACTATILDDDECGLRDGTGDSVPDALTYDPRTRQILLRAGSTDGTFAAGTPLASARGATRLVPGFCTFLYLTGPTRRLMGGAYSMPGNSFFVASGVGTFLTADFDGDAECDDPDDLVAAVRGGVRVGGIVHVDSPSITARSIAAGDFDRDGVLDLVLTDGRRLQVLSGAGEGSFVGHAPVAVPRGLTALTVADIDDDPNGRVDLFGLAGRRLVFIGGNVGRAFEIGSRKIARKPTCLVVRDLDGDGTVDVAVGHASGVVTVVLRPGGFGETVTSRTSLAAATIAACDVDGDQKIDLVLTDRKGRIEVLRGKGTASFGE